MSSRRFKLRDGKSGAAVTVRVTPRAKQNKVSGILADGTIKIRIAAPPEKGKANRALIEFLAEILDIYPSSIEIVAGKSSRDKLVSIYDLDAQTVEHRIMRRLES